MGIKCFETFTNAYAYHREPDKPEKTFKMGWFGGYKGFVEGFDDIKATRIGPSFVKCALELIS